MSAFPARTSVDGIGPPMDQTGGVLNERRAISPRRANIERWIGAGVSQATCRAWCFVTFTAPSTVAISTGSEGSAWQGLAPAVVRTGQGIYTVTYLASYADETGTLVAPDIIMAVVSPKKSTPRLRGDWEISQGRIITVNLYDKTDAAQDGSFGLVLW